MNNPEKINLGSVDWKSSREFFDSLKEELEKLDQKDECYEFTWVGKRKAIIEAGTPINKTLRPVEEKSKDFENTENLYIEGDNLDALKLLQESYLGKIKMIYIDPPYNTGHDFVYHDNFTVKKNEFLDGTTSAEGEVLVAEDSFEENSKANGRFHSDWLSMMYPRLKLARNLLSEDGVIFISIDDNEQANLKKICDEVFGEENFIANIIWQNKYTVSNDKKDGMTTQTEYIAIYARNSNGVHFVPESLRENYVSQNYKNPDNDPNGPYMTVQLYKKKNPKSFEVISPTGKRWSMPWNYTPETFKKLVNDGRVYWGNDGNACPRKKVYLKDSSGVNNRNLWLGTEVGFTGDGGNLIENIFGNRNVFPYPKPLSLSKKIVKIACKEDNIALDFFSGSATTAHAVMQLNAEDGGNRKFILVQWPEETKEGSTAREAGYKNICEIGEERIRRAGEKIQKEHPEAKIDTGFRVLKVDAANERADIYRSTERTNQLDMPDAIDNMIPDRTPLDLLFGSILASALPLDWKLEKRKIGENTMYLYGYDVEGTGLVACFDKDLGEEVIKDIASLKPNVAIFRDSSFRNSAAKINLSEHFKLLSASTKVKVI